MDATANPLGPILADRLRSAKDELAARWLERISDRVRLSVNKIFPSNHLLDHVPLLVEGIAAYVEDPAQVISADSMVMAKAMELGAMRHEQGFDEYELMKEYEIFGNILFAFLAEAANEIGNDHTPGDLMVCAQRLYHGVALTQQATTTHYLQLMKGQLNEREERLRTFERALTHELRNRIGATMGAGRVLQLPGLTDAERHELTDVVVRNADSMRIMLDNLLELTRVSGDTRQARRVPLSEAVAEVHRQLREMAHAKQVEVRIADDLPEIDVPAAAVELSLTNYLANAIKYSDPAKERRTVEVRARTRAEGPSCHVIVEVVDNGLGVPEERRAQLFERFFRAHTEDTSIDGIGLGLSIVRETIQALRGRVWAEFTDEGSVFAFSLPSRRAEDEKEPR